MKNYTFILVLITSALFFGCINKNHNNSLVNIKIDTIRIDLKSNAKADINRFHNIGVVPLETSDNFLIKSIYRVDKTRNGYLITDIKRGVTLLFDEKGKGQSFIANKGKGPGEYIDFSGIFFDPKNEIINIADKYLRSVFQYSLNSNYLQTIKFQNFISGDFSINSKNEYCFFHGDEMSFTGGKNDDVFLYDENGELKKQILKNRNYMNKLMVFKMNNPISLHNDTTHIIRYLDNYIYSISGNNIHKRFYIDLGIEDYSKELILNAVEGIDPDFGDIVFKEHPQKIDELFINEQYVYFSVLTKDNAILRCYYNRKTHKTETIVGYISNGTDHVFPGIVAGITDEYFIYRLEKHAFINWIEQNIKMGVPVNDELMGIYDNSSENDNPILFLYNPEF
jgi:hypothetical protein